LDSDLEDVFDNDYMADDFESEHSDTDDVQSTAADVPVASTSTSSVASNTWTTDTDINKPREQIPISRTQNSRNVAKLFTDANHVRCFCALVLPLTTVLKHIIQKFSFGDRSVHICSVTVYAKLRII